MVAKTTSIKIPSSRIVDMSAISEEQMNSELEKGYADMIAGRTKPAAKVLSNIRKDYNL